MLRDGKDLPWLNRPFAELVRLSWPITLSTLSYSVMTLVDTLMVGRIGSAELAGVGTGGIAAFALLMFSFGLLRGAKTLVSQAVGAGRKSEVGAHLGAAMTAALAIGALTVGLGQILALLLEQVASTPASQHAARTYLSIRILGAPLVLLYVALREVRYGQGDARSPMWASIIANATNIALAATFIYVLGWGVAGVAWATVIAHAVEAGVLALVQHLSAGWGIRRMRREHLAALLRMGLPTGVQFTLEIGSFQLMSWMIASFGDLQMAAHQIGLQVLHFSFLPAFAVGEGASVLAGQAVGAKRDDLVVPVARLAMWVTGAYTLICTVVLVFASRLIAGAFTEDAALIALASRLLLIGAVFQVFDAANIVARAILRGAGDVRVAAVIGVVTSWLFTPPLTWLLGARLGWGAFGSWLGLTSEIIVAALVLWWRLERRHWLRAAEQARVTLADAHRAAA
jgi:multidrug resistance protein, MATE family